MHFVFDTLLLPDSAVHINDLYVCFSPRMQANGRNRMEIWYVYLVFRIYVVTYNKINLFESA